MKFIPIITPICDSGLPKHNQQLNIIRWKNTSCDAYSQTDNHIYFNCSKIYFCVYFECVCSLFIKWLNAT